MAIDFPKTFGTNAQRNASTNRQDLPKAQFWLNFGYVADTIVDGEDKPRFVSLPTGIPLDTTEKLQIRGSNHEHNMFTAARNSLLDQLLEAASALEPGQDYVIECEGGLAVQIRRVAPAAAAPAADESNPFARPKLFSIDRHAA